MNLFAFISSAYSQAALDNDNKLDSMAIDLVANSGYIDYAESGTTSNFINGYTLYSSNNGITATGQEARGNTPKGTYVRAPAWVQVKWMNIFEIPRGWMARSYFRKMIQSSLVS